MAGMRQNNTIRQSEMTKQKNTANANDQIERRENIKARKTE